MSTELLISDGMKLDIDNTISDLMAKQRHPGVSLVITHNDEIVYLRSYGTADFSLNRPMTPDTLVGVGSVSKTFTSVAIHQLCEQGKMNLEDPVSKYLPLKIGDPKHPILVKHILSHSSGIPNLGTLTFPITRMVPTEVVSFRPMSTELDFWSHINNASDEISDLPGIRYYYNNSAFVMLGMIIEKVSGKPFTDYIREYILQPLGMVRSAYTKAEIDKETDHITPYYWPLKNKEAAPVPATFPFEPLGFPAGGLWTSAREIANYMIMLNQDGVFEDKRIITAESLKQAHTPVAVRKPRFEGDKEHGYGLGFDINYLHGLKMVSHGGSMRVSGANMVLFPEIKVGIALLSNTISPPFVITKLIKTLGLGKEQSKVDNRIELMHRIYNKLIGTYSTYKEFNKIEVLRKGNFLCISQLPSVHPAINDLFIYPGEDLDEKNMLFKTVLAPGIYPEIRFEEDDMGIHVDLERYRYHKCE